MQWIQNYRLIFFNAVAHHLDINLLFSSFHLQIFIFGLLYRKISFPLSFWTFSFYHLFFSNLILISLDVVFFVFMLLGCLFILLCLWLYRFHQISEFLAIIHSFKYFVYHTSPQTHTHSLLWSSKYMCFSLISMSHK